MSASLSLVNNDASAVLQVLVPSLSDDLVIIVLSSFLYGILTLLVATSTYILISQGVKRIGHKLLLLGTILLYASSVVYWAAALGYVVSSNNALSNATAGLFSTSYSGAQAAGHIRGLETWYCVMSATFTINICIGDSIVWWRARVLYPDNRIIRRICCFLFSNTFILGIISTASSIHVAERTTGPFLPIVYTGDPWGLAAVAFSLTTNTFSTSLIGYKAWQHRSFLRTHLGARRSTTNVVRMLALLVESGVVYCLIWLLVLAYHICDTVGSPQGRFWRGVSYIHEAALAPAIAIYPMLIVVLVALNKSQLDRGIPGQSLHLNGPGGTTGTGTRPTSTARGANRLSTVRFATPSRLESGTASVSVSSCPVLSTLSLGTRVDSDELGSWEEEEGRFALGAGVGRKGSLGSTGSSQSDCMLGMDEPKQWQ